MSPALSGHAFRHRTTQAAIRLLLLLATIPALLACGISQKYYRKVDRLIEAKDYPAADASVVKDEYGSGSRLLYYFDKGIIAHYAGKWKESNDALDRADEIAEDLFTKSITQRVSSYITNDNVRDYPGEDFEVALIDLFRAVNYLMLGNLENALVMCRKVDHKLKVYKDKYELENKKQKDEAEKVKIAYTEDAFIRYLMALLFEASGETNNAFTAYRNAIGIYRDYAKLYGTPMPGQLPADTLRTARILGLTQEADELLKQFPNLSAVQAEERSKFAEVILLFYRGLAPVKEEFIIDINVSYSNAPIVEVSVPGYQPSNIDPMGIRISLPKYAIRPAPVQSAELVLEGEGGTATSSRADLVEDISAIAVRNLDDRYPSIRRRALVRVLIKAIASRTIDKTASDNLGLAGVLLGAATKVAAKYSEQADLRCWRTLPGQIMMARALVAPGTRKISVRLSNGKVATLGEFALKAGERKILPYAEH